MHNVGVIGAGAWGTALSLNISKKSNVLLWSFDGDYKQFNNISKPDNLVITRDMKDLEQQDIWVLVTPAMFCFDTLSKAKEYYRKQPIIICTKGADNRTNEFVTEILKRAIPECKDFAVLSGPQFAEEVANNIPTGSTIAGNKKSINAGKSILSLHLEETKDYIGTQLCGVGKNVIALINGYNSIAVKGENERALIFTQACNEIIRLGITMGAKVATFYGLCGLGDLFLSATSTTSRNYKGGQDIAKGIKPEGTVEGIYAIDTIINKAKMYNIQTPIISMMKSRIK